MTVQGLVDLTDWCLSSRTWTKSLHELPRKRRLQGDPTGYVSAYAVPG